MMSLLRDADAATYDAKGRGKNRVSNVNPDMHAALLGRLQTRADLESALESGECQLRYQPKVTLETGAAEGFDALLRWQISLRSITSLARSWGVETVAEGVEDEEQQVYLRDLGCRSGPGSNVDAVCPNACTASVFVCRPWGGRVITVPPLPARIGAITVRSRSDRGRWSVPGDS